jgi:hypothetical protein
MKMEEENKKRAGVRDVALVLLSMFVGGAVCGGIITSNERESCNEQLVKQEKTHLTESIETKFRYHQSIAYNKASCRSRIEEAKETNCAEFLKEKIDSLSCICIKPIANSKATTTYDPTMEDIMGE